jgi:4-diphosphocytidyl-2-C-methyl-D-erythritol kinase
MTNKSTSLTLKAHAKINLHLQVGPRRADGYHTIDTLFQEISLHDTLTFAPADSISLRVSGGDVAAGADNLVVRALELLRKKLRTNAGMKATLTKRIPMGAGLGGGSSDAAAALLAGWAIWTGQPPQRAISRHGLPKLLFECAAELGADVAFFLRGGRAHAKGIGEKLAKPQASEKKWLVLVYPRVHVSTPKAYGWIDESRHDALRVSARATGKLKSRPAGNDFEKVVLPRFPAIRAAKEALRKHGCAGVMMSGSGSSVFGFVRNEAAALDVKRALRLKPWDVFAVHTI